MLEYNGTFWPLGGGGKAQEYFLKPEDKEVASDGVEFHCSLCDHQRDIYRVPILFVSYRLC